MSKTYSIAWSFRPRLLTEHLGSHKYTSAVRAVAELVANALDAGASTVRVNLIANQLGGLEYVEVSDNGCGITPARLADRFGAVGIEPSGRESAPFSHFGVGRFAVFSLGQSSEWHTISSNGRQKISARFFWHSSDVDKGFDVTENVKSDEAGTGTTIIISNLRPSTISELTPDRLIKGLLTQFCSFLLGNPSRSILIDGTSIDVKSMILVEDKETFREAGDEPIEGTIRHLQLTTSVDRSRFPAPVLFCAKGRTVATLQLDDDSLDRYLGIVECPHLETIVTSNRESVINFDSTFRTLSEYVQKRVAAYKQRITNARKSSFINRARQQEYYPYKNTTSPIQQAEQAVYDVVLEQLHSSINLENMAKKHQAVLFKLLQRTIRNDDVLEIVSQVADLSDEAATALRDVLEQTTLESIIKLSTEATRRISFLKYLHDLTYGTISKRVRERSHLHKIIEGHCWIFSPRFHLATSDQNFRAIIKKHREAAGLESIPDDILLQVDAYDDIPDLFLTASRDYPSPPRHQHLLVELKAPKVTIGTKELGQLRRYAKKILESDEFSKESASWDLILVSSSVNEDAEIERTQASLPYGCINKYKHNMDLWVFTWSELVQRAREEMQLVLDHLNQRSVDLKVTDFLKQHYPDIFTAIGANGTNASPAVPNASDILRPVDASSPAAVERSAAP